ncbi:heterodisulfide reductase-related iron-sulfur binding cluster [Streptomyces sp. NPDC014724]|uniref:heterodisulfide reductase-related iron-sulfur binding cluster n=1 Tax=unclassified Streptomyces TaxID=2593676 RepID=UPI003701C713
MRVALFLTCFNGTLFPGTGWAVVTVLERLGHTVDFPLEQTCCGQMHFNTGYRPEAVPLVERFARTFEAYDAGAHPAARRRRERCLPPVRLHPVRRLLRRLPCEDRYP